MIPYSRDPAKTIPPSSVKILGLGGAGANMLERIALDGMEGTELCALNTDIRTLSACIAREKIQLGANLTKGLGAGGDPELGNKAVLEAEEEIRASLKDFKIVFVCCGLGGGTGSGAAPIVTRIAREEGAFVVVFATTPFAFEGQRRRDQAESALNELAVLSNALVTFDNNRMGELVLAKQGIHEAFTAADQMISESIKSVIRLVVRPGLINVGLDELMTALKTNRSRCLFGSGMATGTDRASKALRSALASPLLDEGALLKEAQSVLVHLCGGEDLTLFEVELLMQQLQKFVPEKAQVLFGAAIDPAMADSLSVTLISALPEESLAMAPRESISQAEQDSPLLQKPARKTAKAASAPAPSEEPTPASAEPPAPEEEPSLLAPLPSGGPTRTDGPPPHEDQGLFDEQRPFAEPDEPKPEAKPEAAPVTRLEVAKKPAEQAQQDAFESLEKEPAPPASAAEAPALPASPAPRPAAEIPAKRSGGEAPWSPNPRPAPQQAEGTPETDPLDEQLPEPMPFVPTGVVEESDAAPVREAPPTAPREAPPTAPREAPPTAPREAPPTRERDEEFDKEVPKLKLGVKPSEGHPNELSLDSTPRGRFEGEDPNVVDGEDLDLPPFLRKKK